jgi:hypothetical protein
VSHSNPEALFARLVLAGPFQSFDRLLGAEIRVFADFLDGPLHLFFSGRAARFGSKYRRRYECARCNAR